MQHNLNSKFMIVNINNGILKIMAFDHKKDVINKYCLSGEAHYLEDASVNITSNDTTIKGIEFFIGYLKDCKLSMSENYEFTEDDIEDRDLFMTVRCGFWRDEAYKRIGSEKYLKMNTYVLKKRKDFHLVCNLPWMLSFSNGELLPEIL